MKKRKKKNVVCKEVHNILVLFLWGISPLDFTLLPPFFFFLFSSFWMGVANTNALGRGQVYCAFPVGVGICNLCSSSVSILTCEFFH